MAADDLPMPVVTFLNTVGVPWPYLNEDMVRMFASFVGAFRQALTNSHQKATESVKAIAKVHKGKSTNAMMSGWANLAAAHVNEVTCACAVLEDALKGAADYIVAQKAIAVDVLIGLATAFFADQAAAFISAGFSEAALPLLDEAADKVVESLEQDVSMTLQGDVIERAAKPLLAKISAMMTGLDWSQSGATTGDSDGLSVDAAAVSEHTTALRATAAQLRSEVAGLAAQVRSLKFA